MDYTQLRPVPLTLRRGSAPPVVTLATNGDSISQEGDEDFFINLSVVGALPPNVFLRDRLRVVIIDATGIALYSYKLSAGIERTLQYSI